MARPARRARARWPPGPPRCAAASRTPSTRGRRPRRPTGRRTAACRPRGCRRSRPTPSPGAVRAAPSRSAPSRSACRVRRSVRREAVGRPGPGAQHREVGGELVGQLDDGGLERVALTRRHQQRRVPEHARRAGGPQRDVVGEPLQPCARGARPVGLLRVRESCEARRAARRARCSRPVRSFGGLSPEASGTRRCRERRPATPPSSRSGPRSRAGHAPGRARPVRAGSSSNAPRPRPRRSRRCRTAPAAPVRWRGAVSTTCACRSSTSASGAGAVAWPDSTAARSADPTPRPDGRRSRAAPAAAVDIGQRVDVDHGGPDGAGGKSVSTEPSSTRRLT